MHLVLVGVQDDAHLFVDAVFEGQFFEETGVNALFDNGQLISADHLRVDQVFDRMAGKISNIIP